MCKKFNLRNFSTLKFSIIVNFQQKREKSILRKIYNKIWFLISDIKLTFCAIYRTLAVCIWITIFTKLTDFIDSCPSLLGRRWGPRTKGTLSKSIPISISVDRSRWQIRDARARTRRRRSRAIYGIANVGTARRDSRACVRNRSDIRRPRCGFTDAGRRGLHQKIHEESTLGLVRSVVHDDGDDDDNDDDTTRENAPRRGTASTLLRFASVDDGTDE